MTVGTRKEKVNVFRHYGHTCTFLSKEKRRKRKKERKAKFRGCSCLKYKYIKSMEITLKVLLLKTRSLRANFANFEKERGWILLISFSFLIFYSVSSLSYKFYYPFPSFSSNFIRIQPYMCIRVLISTFSSVIYNLSNFGTRFFSFPIKLKTLKTRSLRANFANFQIERGWIFFHRILLISFPFVIFYSVSSLSYKFYYPFLSFSSNFIRIQPYMCRYTVLISTFSSVIYNLSNFGTQFFDFPINLWNLRSTFRSSHVHS